MNDVIRLLGVTYHSPTTGHNWVVITGPFWGGVRPEWVMDEPQLSAHQAHTLGCFVFTVSSSVSEAATNTLSPVITYVTKANSQ